MSFKEFEFISQLPKASHPFLSTGIGDDAAVFQGSFPWAISSDALAEGSHFLSEDDPYEIGQKTASVNLSDMAAMGCEPCFFILNLHVGSTWTETQKIERFMAGLLDRLKSFNVALIGGDTVRSKERGLQVSGTILGKPYGQGPILRSTAQVGDLICVTGALGGSFPKRHLVFEPKVNMAKEICQRITPHSMMDISDGLAQDLSHICRLSCVGARLELEHIPIHVDALEHHRGDCSRALQAALSDGEDFELLFTIAPEDVAKIPSELNVSVVGHICAENKLEARSNSEAPWLPLEPKGFSHDA